MEQHEKEWIESHGAKMIAELGITKSNTVLDFGCGRGRYTIPLSQAVGDQGRVLAIERNTDELAILQARMDQFATPAPVQTLVSDTLYLETVEENSVDGMLAFDVLQYVDDWNTFFCSGHRALKPGAMLHVYPASIPHPGQVDIEKLTTVLKDCHFSLTAKRQFHMMHNKDMVDDHVLSFTRA